MSKVFNKQEISIIAGMKQACEEGELKITCRSPSDAIALRAKCYSLAKIIRVATETQPELYDLNGQISQVTMSIKDNVLRMYRKDLDAGIQALMSTVDPKYLENADPNKEIVEDSQAEFMRKMGMVAVEETPIVVQPLDSEGNPLEPAKPSNPYTSALRNTPKADS